MRKVTILTFALLLSAGLAFGQSTEYIFSPESTGELSDPFAVYEHNGARGLSGPWDLDGDGLIEVLVAQHNSAGGRVHVIENVGPDNWELVYSTAFIDSSASSSNARYATGADLDGDGNWEIVYVAGTGYDRETHPAFKNGVYVWEHDGVAGSDNYGALPATVGNFIELDGFEDSFVRAQNIEAMDIDNDGTMEVFFAADGDGTHDVFYVLSVNGTFETNGVGTGFETWVIEARIGPRENGNAFGGGSPYDLIAGDFNGDGNMDLSLHSWNFFNFFNATVEDGQVVFPDAAAENRNYRASEPDDHVALFGGIAFDIDQDGNTEVFYPNWQTKSIGVLDYDQGEDVLMIGPDNFAFDAIPIGGAGGIAVGDIDGDGHFELIVGGNGYQASDYEDGTPSQFITVAEFMGGDPSDGANYSVEAIDTSSPADTTGFNIVRRDSLGVLSRYFETALSKQGTTTSDTGDPLFPSGIAYLGDADGDGNVEIAVSFQGVDDSLYVYDEVWNVDSLRYDRTVGERMASPARSFVRIFSMDGRTVSVEDNRIVLPSDYVLEGNYPNPFNPSTTIRFTLPLDKAISVRVYDVAGRLVKTLIDGQRYNAGTHEVAWDGTNQAGAGVASGTYVYTLEYGNFRQSQTMILLK